MSTIPLLTLSLGLLGAAALITGGDSAAMARVLLDALMYLSLTAKMTFLSFYQFQHGSVMGATSGDIPTEYNNVNIVTTALTLLLHVAIPSDESAAAMQLQMLNFFMTSPFMATTIVPHCAKLVPDKRFWFMLFSFCTLLVPGCSGMVATWFKVGSTDMDMCIFTAGACISTSVGLCLWAHSKNYELGGGAGHLEKMNFTPVQIFASSAYNAVVEEVNYRGIYLAGLLHYTAMASTSQTLIGPGLGLALSLAFCAHMDIFQKLAEQEKFQLEPPQTTVMIINVAMLVVTVVGSVAVSYLVMEYDTEKRITMQAALACFVQGFVFAEGHRVGGLPNGKQGFVMLLAWATGLGVLRLLTDGMLLIWVAHIAGDSTILFMIRSIVASKGKKAT